MKSQTTDCLILRQNRPVKADATGLTQARSPYRPWYQFHGWRIVGAGAAISAIGSGLVVQGFASYAVLLREEFAWSTALLAVAFALNRAESGLLGPFQGWLTDRIGPRRVLQMGALITAVGFLLFSRVNSIWQFLLFYPIVAIGIALAGFLTIVTTVVNWFERRRALALALYSAGFALGGVFAPLLVWFLDRYGWRSGAVASAVVVLAVVLPLSRLFDHRPSDRGETVDGLDPDLPTPPRPEHATPLSEVHFTAREAMRTRAFWFISLGHMTALLVVSVVLAHLALYLTEDQGITLQQAAFVIGVLPFLQLAGQTAGGYLGDRYDKRLLSAGAMVGHVVGLLLLAFGDLWVVVLFIPLHGFAWGLRGPLMQAMRADYFGATDFGKILGFSSLVVMLGTIVGPILAGTLNDATGSYRLGFTVVALLASTGVAFFLLATPPPPPDRAA